MSTIRCSSNIDCPNLPVNASRHAIYALIIGSVLMFGLSGCGQKGELYLAETSSQTVTDNAEARASQVLNSTSNPQDTAFANIDDDNYQKTRYLEQKQVLPEASDDPNDY